MYFAQHLSNFYNLSMLMTHRVMMDPRFDAAMLLGSYADDFAQLVPSILSAFI